MKSRKLFTDFIKLYQKWLSPLKKPSCVFYPTCSEYTQQAIQKYGIPKGIFLGLGRLLRCHPWQKNHFDPVVSFGDAQSAPKKASPKSTNRVDPLG
jgi:putative membrane protein insertion efficiency factor